MLSGFADQHVHAATVTGLRRRGMDVVTAQERGQCGVDDDVLLGSATAERRLLLTYDTDFLRIHAEWLKLGKDHVGIVFWHGNQLSIGEAIRRILDYAQHTDPADAENMVKYL